MKSRLGVRRLRLSFALLSVVFFGLLSASYSLACDTPVYRYAMYKWQPAPYEIYFFHDTALTEADLQVRHAIEKYSEDQQLTANLDYFPVNISAAESLDRIHPRIKEAWLARKEKELPSYMVVNPRGIQIYSGKLDVAAVHSLVDSPARAKMNSLLEKGNPGVLILLEGKDEKANLAAEKILHELTTAIAAGKLDLFTPPETNPGDASAVKPKVKPEISAIRISPDDEKEQWLVRLLLGIEEDLKEEENRKQPMAFIAYGRGRALPPFMGKGITFDNVAEDIAFISGACSCTVKEQNPGVDLLTHYDWEAAAESLTDLFGVEEGNEGNLSDLFPEIISTAEIEAQLASADSGNFALTSSDIAENSASTDTEQPSDSTTTTTTSADGTSANEAVETSESISAIAPSAETSNRSLMLTMGIGLVAGFVALVAVSFFLLKPR